MDLILASQSPRRRALLQQFGLAFRVEVLPVQEVQSGPPLETARINAVAKAQPVSARNPQALVLGADTIVVLDGRILGKPADAQEAADMLRAL
ncbi:MAG: Maf family protein, partial [Limnochordia bacterium]